MISKDSRKLLDRLLGYCPYCHKYFKKGVSNHRRPTNYNQSSLNFLFACNECRDRDVEQLMELGYQYFNRTKEVICNDDNRQIKRAL